MARPKNRLSHKKEAYYILCIVAVLAILAFSLFGPGGYRDLRQSRRELERQRERVNRLERGNYERMKSIEKLRSDRDALEGYAREKGYGREGEIIQQLPQPPAKSK